MPQKAEGPGPILVVDDEPSIMSALLYSLEREGYEVESASDGVQALKAFRDSSPSLVLLDLMLPGISGLDLCRIFRAESTVPILMLTAKDAESDKVVGLEMGADDYITKPFSSDELLCRIRAHLRRACMMQPPSLTAILRSASLELDPVRHALTIRGDDVAVPPKEFALLKVLLEGAGRLQTRESLIRRVWGDDYYGDTRTLDVHIKRLRSKIEVDGSRPKLLKTVRGLGYRFDPE